MWTCETRSTIISLPHHLSFSLVSPPSWRSPSPIQSGKDGLQKALVSLTDQLRTTPYKLLLFLITVEFYDDRRDTVPLYTKETLPPFRNNGVIQVRSAPYTAHPCVPWNEMRPLDKAPEWSFVVPSFIFRTQLNHIPTQKRQLRQINVRFLQQTNFLLSLSFFFSFCRTTDHAPQSWILRQVFDQRVTKSRLGCRLPSTTVRYISAVCWHVTELMHKKILIQWYTLKLS